MSDLRFALREQGPLRLGILLAVFAAVMAYMYQVATMLGFWLTLYFCLSSAVLGFLAGTQFRRQVITIRHPSDYPQTERDETAANATVIPEERPPSRHSRLILRIVLLLAAYSAYLAVGLLGIWACLWFGLAMFSFGLWGGMLYRRPKLEIQDPVEPDPLAIPEEETLATVIPLETKRRPAA